MVICLERGADLHMAQLMPLPLTVSCFSKIQIGVVPGSSGKRAVERVCVCVCVSISKGMRAVKLCINKILNWRCRLTCIVAAKRLLLLYPACGFQNDRLAS